MVITQTWFLRPACVESCSGQEEIVRDLFQPAFYAQLARRQLTASLGGCFGGSSTCTSRRRCITAAWPRLHCSRGWRRSPRSFSKRLFHPSPSVPSTRCSDSLHRWGGSHHRAPHTAGPLRGAERAASAAWAPPSRSSSQRRPQQFGAAELKKKAPKSIQT